jgi:hypothetical protein
MTAEQQSRNRKPNITTETRRHGVYAEKFFGVRTKSNSNGARHREKPESTERNAQKFFVAWHESELLAMQIKQAKRQKLRANGFN